MAAKVYPHKYNLRFPRQVDDLELELWCYRRNHPISAGGLGRAGHFRKIVDLLWGPHNKRKQFIWHPWAERMNESVHRDEVLEDGTIRQQRYIGISGCAWSGKCLAPATRVLMFNGTTKAASDVTVGDLLMGDDSTPRTVLSCGDGRSNMVRIVPEKGEPWECNDDHILTLKRTWSNKKSWRKVGQVFDISVKDYLASTITFRRKVKLMCVGANFPERGKTEFHPRAYGIWLGDGTTDRPQITSHDSEIEVNAFITDYFHKAGYRILKYYKKGTRCASYNISTAPGRSVNPFRNFVRESSPAGKKRILERYLFADRASRLLLLAGLIDSDGYGAKTFFEISCSQPDLASDIVFLARSLGFRVTTKNRVIQCNGRGCPCQRINIAGNVQEIPTLRKKCRLKGNRQNSNCSAFKIEQLGEGDWSGFTLDGNGRFLLADFTVTHNSCYIGIYALVQWMSDPINTLGLCTSTDIKAARRRIWSQIKGYFKAAEDHMPGNLVDSQAVILTVDDNGKTVGDNCGIMIIPGEKKHEAEAIDKIIGAHNKRVFLLADELPELSPGLMEAAYSNLAINPFFQMVGLGNFKTRYDPFGQFVEPAEGYGSITVEDQEWKTRRGICIRFDGMKSPNLDEVKDIYPIYGRKELAAHKADLGENTAGFWRMCRSFETPLGTENVIFSESDLIDGKAYEQPVWLGIPTELTAMDPSFTQGGDRCPQIFGKIGRTKDGIMTLAVSKIVLLREDVRNKSPRDYQIARQFRDNAKAANIPPENAALDSTAAGGVLWSIISEEWSPSVLKVDFSGAPSDMIVTGSKTGKQSYDRKVSELWHVGKHFIRRSQVRGLTPELTREMKAREFETVKSSDGLKVRIETKDDMKKRLLFSPDLADSFFVLLHLARARLAFMVEGGGGGNAGARRSFVDLAKSRDSVHRELYSVEQ